MIKVEKDKLPDGDRLITITVNTEEEATAVIRVIIEQGMLFSREGKVFTLNRIDVSKLRTYLPSDTTFEEGL